MDQPVQSSSHLRHSNHIGIETFEVLGCDGHRRGDGEAFQERCCLLNPFGKGILAVLLVGQKAENKRRATTGRMATSVTRKRKPIPPVLVSSTAFIVAFPILWIPHAIPEPGSIDAAVPSRPGRWEASSP